jgi:carbonic anhydrase/acetyltransferase-like protein (isoleucine patch superfamily)
MSDAPGLRKARMRKVGRAYVADTATVTGEVTLGDDANIWYGVLIRGDDAPIHIGARTNIQDNAVVHVDPDAPNVIGADCTIGHGALVHGVEVGDRVLIGMGAILLGGSKVGEGCVIGAGAVVLENTAIPPYSLVVGAPAKVIRTHDAWERTSQAIRHATHYVEQAKKHAAGGWDGMVRV